MVLINSISDLFKGALDFLLPPLCAGCGKFDTSGQGICEECQKRIDTFAMPTCLMCKSPIADGISCTVCGANGFPLYAYGDYQPPLRDIVIQIKFKGVTPPVVPVVSRLIDQFGEKLQSQAATCLVPIPLHQQRRNRRGYNQAELIADALAPYLHVPVRTELIMRTKKRKPQARLDFKHRADNIKGVFSVIDDASERERVILVDDVATTGATVLEARRVLQAGGHHVVAAVTLAHGV